MKSSSRSSDFMTVFIIYSFVFDSYSLIFPFFFIFINQVFSILYFLFHIFPHLIIFNNISIYIESQVKIINIEKKVILLHNLFKNIVLSLLLQNKPCKNKLRKNSELEKFIDCPMTFHKIYVLE